MRPTHTKAETRLKNTQNSHLAVAFVGGGRISPDEESLVLLKLVVHLSFTYSVLKGLVYNYSLLLSFSVIFISTYRVNFKNLTCSDILQNHIQYTH